MQQQKHTMHRQSKRSWLGSNNTNISHIKFLIIFGLRISISIIGCNALPRPHAHPQNDIDEFRQNFAASFGAPLITPLKEEIKLDAGSSFTLRCESNEPIKWETSKYLPLTSKPFKTEDPDKYGKYGIALQLNSVSYMDVGYYYCIKEASRLDVESMEDEQQFVELVNDNQASSIYVFVNDKMHLLAPINSLILEAHQYDDVVVPCKPTMPEVEVLLTASNGETYSSETSGRYDPRRGFVIGIRGITDCGDYICRPKIPSPQNEEEETQLTLDFLGNEHIPTKTTSINKPKIFSKTRGHVYEGDDFELICEVITSHEVRYTTKWSLPPNVDRSRVVEGTSYYNSELKNDTHISGRTVLTVRNAQKSDQGSYVCNVEDHSNNKAHTSYLMTVLKPNESYIELREPNDYYKIKEKANKTVTLSVKYRGYPEPTLTWYKPDGSEIWQTDKFAVNFTESTSTLKIANVQMKDTGKYTLRADNGINTKKLEFNLSITDAPIISVDDIYVQAGEEAHLECHVTANPPAFVTWVFKPCDIKPRWPSCDKKLQQDFNSSRNARPGDSNIEYIHELYFMPERPGIMSCLAQNIIGMAPGKAHVLIGDIGTNMTIYGLDEELKIARGDEITITCAALAYYYSDTIEWYKNGEPVIASENLMIISSSSNYSHKKTLKFMKIKDDEQGTYECRVRHVNFPKEEPDTRDINVFVHEPASPTMTYTNMDPKAKLKRNLGESLELECKTHAIPRATVRWFRDDIEVVETNKTHLLEDNTKLLIPHLYPEDDGIFRCLVENRLGATESSVTIVIANLPTLKLGWIMFIVFFIFLVLIGLCLYFWINMKREQKKMRELKAAGLANFEEGAVELINPALTLDEQADLLPYDRSFEFPREKLKLGKQLGAGAFGVVLKAHAEGICPEEKETVVAVKMVKRSTDNEVMRALVSELKIMAHMGKHLNVVNLLGAITKNIAKRELMVIVEYCRYGNVQNFLLRNRKRFINQIHPDTDKIDPSIMTQRFSDNFELHRDSDNDPRSGTRAGRPGSAGYVRTSDMYEGQVDTCATEQTVMTTIPEDDENILSNNSIQPAWRSNYKPDSTEAMTITTSDLISWAFQVARGMDYLASRKVLHGDLAARNILLCEDNVVKICDFGLARSMYRGDNYKKQGEAKLPIKWLALESLSDYIFSTYTDVWSFGIVLWEFFSLAKVPYPGMDPNQNLYLKLKDGYRMEKPPYANNDLYDIMLECWSTNPESRPLFNVLEKRFAHMLGDDVTNHYVDLNEPYLRINTEYARNTQTDYLALMGSPDEMAPPPPRYINGHILPEIRIETPEDYLEMSANTGTAIFSSTRPYDNTDDVNKENFEKSTTSFTFPVASGQHSPTLANNLDSNTTHKQIRRKDGIEPSPEEIPMLHNVHHNKSGSEDCDKSSEKPHQFANILQQVNPHPKPSPRHHVETKLNAEDKYVNVKPPRMKIPSTTISPACAISNPSYEMLKTVNDHGERK